MTDDNLDERAIRREALSWVFRLHLEDMSEEDTDAMLQWRARNPAHAQALSDAVKLRRRLEGAASRLVHEDAVRPAQPPAARAQPLVARRAFIGSALAASLGAVALVRPPLGLWPSLAELGADYRTATGERRTIELAQGITVELNTRTSIARREDPQALRVELIEGEIAIDATHPELKAAVQTGAGLVSARRARFVVRLTDAGTCVTCMNGRLSVRDAQQRSATLAAGGQLTFDGSSAPAPAVVNIENAEAWRRGLLVFNGDPLREVVREINRYRPGRIILTNDKLGGFPVSGTFQLARLDRAVAQLEQVVGTDATSLPGGVVLLG